jgi:tetratricopeptide (TPR) repeat protein
MNVRWPFVLGLMIVTTIGVAVFIGVRIRGQFQAAASASGSAAQGRVERTTPLVEVAPGPVPTKLPLIGSEEKSADGYPLANVDAVGLRSLMWHSRWDDLDRWFGEYQDAFEKDEKCEYWPLDAAMTFGSAESSLTPKLDAWVAARPKSFAALLARGSHRLGVAWAMRGNKYVGETHGDNLKAMRDQVALALADLDAAIALRPKLVAAMHLRMRTLSLVGGREEKLAEVNRATKLCPGCFAIRASYLVNTTPRWGGTYEVMRAFAATCDSKRNARCRWLGGYPDFDQAQVAELAKRHDDAAAAIERALSFGDNPTFLGERGEIRLRAEQWEAALADFERAVAVRPNETSFVFGRAHALFALKRWEPAGAAFLSGLRVDPTDGNAKRLAANVVQGLVYDGWEHHKAGRRDDALRVLDLAAELAPTDREVLSRRSWVILGTEQPDIPALEAAVAKSPDDLRLHQQLDYALALKNNFARVIEVWTGYLARHPEEGRAYLERGGAYFRLGKRAEAKADAARACDLGINEGCARAK